MKLFRLLSWGQFRNPRDTLESADLSGHHYRRLVIGGGIVISLAVMVAALVQVTLVVERYFYERKQIFLDQRDLVKTNLENHQARLRQTVEAFEMLSHFTDKEEFPTEKYKKLLEANLGAVTLGPDVTVTPFSLLASSSGLPNDSGLKSFLSLAREISPSPLLRESYTGYFLGGFAYSTDRNFLVTWPVLPPDVMNSTRRVGAGNVIDRYIEIVEAEMAHLSPEKLRKQRIIWVSLHNSLLNGQLVTYYAVPVYHQSERVAVVVVAVPLDKFPQLFQNSTHEQGFFVVSRDRKHLFGGDNSWCDVCLTKAVLDSPTVLAHTNQHVEISRQGEFFFMSQPVPGPDWIAVYVFDWYSVFTALRYKLFLVALLTLCVLASVWVFIFLLERLVLKPLRRQSQQIFESEMFNRTILDAAPVGLAVYDPLDDRIVMQNEAARKLFNSVLGGVEHVRDFVEPRFRDAVYQFKTQANQHDLPTIEATFLTQDGGSTDIAIAFSQARHQQREVVLIRLTNISSQNATLRLYQEAREAADQASHAKSMFLAMMSHEVRTPLHGALGNLELLSLEELTLPQKERVLVIRRAFDALLVLINDILDLSKIEADELRLNIEPFRVEEVIEHCALVFSPSIQGKGVRFLCVIDPRLSGTWLGDGHRLTQVLMNVLSNAIKFTEAGSITLRAQLGATTDGSSWISVTVSDTGIGISQERLERVFEPFVQADQSIDSQFGGSGLGLTLCRRILSLMGGNIRVDSEEEVGSIFTIEFPLTQNNPSDHYYASQASCDFSTVVIACDSLLWRVNLVDKVKRWFPALEVIDVEIGKSLFAPNQNSVLVLTSFGPETSFWLDVNKSYADTILISPYGPLSPARHENFLYVTSLSASLFHACLSANMKYNGSAYPTSNAIAQVPVYKKIKVLIAEDDPISRVLLENQLGILGCDQVDSFEDGLEALDQCRKASYDLIITDLGMPLMGGEAFLKSLRAEGVLTPVILCTAETGIRAPSNLLDFSEVLYKPIALDFLRAALGKVLDALYLPENCPPSSLDELSALRKLQSLFLEGWEGDEYALNESLRLSDSRRFLARIHRLKGALFALGENDMAEACDELHDLIDDSGLECAKAEISAFFERVHSLTSLLRSGDSS